MGRIVGPRTVVSAAQGSGRASTSGLLLLLIGALGLIGFLNGQLDRWLAWLFKPPDAPPATSSTAAAAVAAANRRGQAG